MTKVCQVGWHEPFGLCDRTSLGDRVALAGHAIYVIFMSYLCHHKSHVGDIWGSILKSKNANNFVKKRVVSTEFT